MIEGAFISIKKVTNRLKKLIPKNGLDAVKIIKTHLFSKKTQIFIIALAFELFILRLLGGVSVSSYTSMYPKVFLFAVLIAGLWLILSEEIYKIEPKALVGVLLSVLALQAAVPIFAPKVTISEPTTSFGEIELHEDGIKYIQSGQVSLKIKPPLFPIWPFTNYITIPLALTNLTEVDYAELLMPSLVSRIFTEKNNAAKIHIFADGWTYDELNVKLRFKGDRYPPFGTSVYLSSNLFSTRINDKNTFVGYLSLYNREPFMVCYKDWVFTIQNQSYSQLRYYRPVSNFSTTVCTALEGGSCTMVDTSVDGMNFAYGINWNDLSSERLFLKAAAPVCINPNSTTEYRVLRIEPNIQIG